MPNVSIMTTEVEDSVIRPAILDIISQLKKITNIPQDTRVLYLDYLNAGYQRGSTMTQQSADERDRSAFSFNNQLAIEVETNYEEGNVNSTAITRPEHIPIIDDNRLGLFVRPIYFKYNFVISVRYRSKSPTEGKRWRDAIRMNISNMRDINLHDIQYHYPIPGEIINIIKEIHRLRENVDGYGETIEDYLASISSTRLTTLSNQAGTQKQVAVAEKQMRVLGQYDFTIAPEKGDIDSEGHAWTTSFNYNVSFDVPVAINIKYPLMIHNQLLDEPYVSYDTEAYDIDKVNKAYTLSLGDFAAFESTYQTDRYREQNKIVRIPEFDEFLPTSSVHGTQPLFSALCEVDPDNKKLLLNLNELGDFALDSEVMEFIKKEYQYLTLPYKSIFHVSLYKWVALSNDASIYVDRDLNVLARSDLSFRVNHRVVFSIVKDITMLERDSLTRLKKHKSVAIKLLKSLNVNAGILNLIAHKVNFNPILPDIAQSGINLKELQKSYYQFNTVNTSMIIAHRKMDHETLNKLRQGR